MKKYLLSLLLIVAFVGLNPHVIGAQTISYIEQQWQYYDQKLLTGEDGQPDHIVNLPVELDELNGEPSGYGTFIKQITLPEETVGEMMAIYLPFVYGAANVYVDGKLIGQIGTVGETAEQHETNLESALFPVAFTNKTATIAIQISSFNHIRGGLSDSIQIDTFSALNESLLLEDYIIIFSTAIVFVVGLFTLSIGILGKQQRVMLIFGVFCLFVSIRALFGVPFIYHDLPITVSYVWATKLEYISTCLAFFMYILFIYESFKVVFSKYVVYFCAFVLLGIPIVTLFTQPKVFQTVFFNSFPLILCTVLYVLFIIFRAIYKRIKLAKVVFVGILFVFAGLIVDLFSGLGYISTVSISLFTIMLNVILILMTLSRNYVIQLMHITELNYKLVNVNKTLDDKVTLRTNELVIANERLANLAQRDGLTHIFNRHRFDELLQESFKESVQLQKPLAILMLDVDEFKKYNDYYGHVKGDQLLIRIVRVINECLPDDAIFARYGGEEFVIVLYNYTRQEAQQMAQIIIDMFDTVRMEHAGREIGYVTISIGGAERIEENEKRPIDLVAKADERLYISKALGRNRVTFTSQSNKQYY